MGQKVRTTLALIGGGLLIIIGIAGFFLPFVQGIVLILLGLYVLMRFSPKFREYTTRFRGRHHVIDSFLDRLDRKLDKNSGNMVAAEISSDHTGRGGYTEGITP